ncbi:MAG: DUF4249 family protein [Bacteroidia bacterium]|nr:DUF4249 family protein [Bacteroidia bacterium]
MKNILYLLLATTLLSSCEKVITVQLQEGEAQLVVDAFLNNDTLPQTIKLRTTQPYFDNSPAPAVTGATVTLETTIPAFPPYTTIETQRTLIFTDPNNTGDYTWKPDASNILTSRLTLPFLLHKLIIKTQGEQYEAYSFSDDVLKIDSLWSKEAKNDSTGAMRYKLDMKARDLSGRPNFTWFKTYRNGKLIGIPKNIVTCYDAAFGPGTDGSLVIPPIIDALSPENFYKGDVITVEAHAIDQFGYVFFNLALAQINNTGLFASPTTNTPSNVVNVTHKGSKEPRYKALGCFSVAVVTRKTITVK